MNRFSCRDFLHSWIFLCGQENKKVFQGEREREREREREIKDSSIYIYMPYLDRTFFLHVAKAFHILNLAKVPILTSWLKWVMSVTHWASSVNWGSRPAIILVTP